MNPTYFAAWTPTEHDRFDVQKAAHLLRRSGFGGSPEQVAKSVSEGVEASVEGLFADDSAEDRDFARTFEAIAGSLEDFSDADRLRAWWVYRMVKTSSPLREKLTLFWHGHFATSVEKVEDVHLMHGQVETIRRLALGNFRDLVLALAKDPAMLVWLDGQASTKAHPNENFGRELMELFTVGIGNYTEGDVQAAAKAFTGWNREGAEFRFKADEHDGSRKQFLGKTGRFDGGDIVDLLIQHPATARRVATQLLRFFACPEPAAKVIDEAALLLERTRLDIKWFLRELFQSRYFFSTACYRTRISSPAEFVVGTTRTLSVRWASPELVGRMATMGQVLYAPPNVKGWDGETKWINSSTLAARSAFGSEIANLAEEGPFAATLDLARLVPDSIREPSEVVDHLVAILFQGALPVATRRELAEFLVTREEANGSQAFREDDDFRRQKTRSLLGLLLALPEYQSC